MSKNKIKVFKGDKEIEVTEKSYRVVYKNMGFKPTEKKKQEKPISEMTKKELEGKAFEYAIELESTKVDDMKKELDEKIEEIEQENNEE